MIDIHTHILPGIDDGAKDVEMSLRLLEMQRRSGVDKIILTPHFDLRSVTPDEFLSRRDAAFSLLKSALGNAPAPELKLGAEVRFTAELLDLDLHRFTLGGSDYLLLELPVRQHPTMLDAAVDRMLDQGIIPILAHVERYPYFHTDPGELVDLISMGALAQVSAEAVIGRSFRSFTGACLKKDVAHLIASDTHNDTGRRPCLSEVRGRIPDAILGRTEAFARAVWENVDPPLPQPKKPGVFFCRDL